MLAQIGPTASGHHDQQAKEPGQEDAVHEPSRKVEGIGVGFEIFPLVADNILRKDQPTQHWDRRRIHHNIG